MATSYRFLGLIVVSMLFDLIFADPVPDDAQGQLDSFCRRFSHRTAVISNRIYIDGGFVNLNSQGPNPVNYTNTDLFYADLLHSTKYGMPAMEIAPTENSTVPSVAGGALWADSDNNVFYAFGGYFPLSRPPAFVTWLYNAVQGSWISVPAQGNPSYVAYGMAAVAGDAGVGYYLGGYHDNRTQDGWSSSRLYTPNLVAFDMNTRTYTNNSGPDNKGRGEGLMVFIPASTSGLLIYFGGVVQDQSTGETSGVSMADIGIYDIATSQWYTQNATGEVPEQRTRFCGGVAHPDDKSSFNIYIYGGLRPNGTNIDGTTAFDDVYILTLPAFVWIKWYPAASVNATRPYGHHSLTCDVINGTQMIVMGGTFPDIPGCDVPSEYGQHNLNLAQNNPENALWNTFVLDFPPYTVPPAIVNIVGGTSKGGANVTQPANSTASYNYYLFQRTYNGATRTPTPTTTTSSAASSSASTSNTGLSRGALIGTIVAAAIGGILLSSAALCGFLLFRRSKRERQVDSQQVASLVTQTDKILDDEKRKNITAATELGAEHIVELPGGQQNAAELWTTPIELPARSDRTLQAEWPLSQSVSIS